jgi:hypothetical protein
MFAASPDDHSYNRSSPAKDEIRTRVKDGEFGSEIL